MNLLVKKAKRGDTEAFIALVEEYASNQAIYIGICIENEQKFPEMASLADGSGLQRLLLWTTETYSFRPGQIQGARYLEENWNYQLSIAHKDEASRVIMINEINEAGIGIESIEISSVEMTINPIEPADAFTIAVALDAEGRQMESGSSNLYELAIQDHDISTVYLYILDYEEYMDELKGYRLPGNEKYDFYQQILEERAPFKTVVETDG